MKNKLHILPVLILSLVLLASGCSAPGVAVLPPEPAGSDINVTTGTQPPAATNSIPVTTDPAPAATAPAQPPPSTPAVSTPPYAPPPATPVPVPVEITEEKPTMNIILGTFEPGKLTVAKNTEVVFGDIDHYNYRIFSPGLFDTDLLSEDIFVFIFSEPGTYNVWIDSVQKGETMEGVVIVTE
jgi:hypothetical protein